MAKKGKKGLKKDEKNGKDGKDGNDIIEIQTRKDDVIKDDRNPIDKEIRPFSYNITAVKTKQEKLEKKIDNVLNDAGKGDLKYLRALAHVINLIKDEYTQEGAHLKKQFTRDTPVQKIIVYFTKQIYLKLYIKYSIKYINSINFQFTPEFKQKFIQNIQKVQDLEKSLGRTMEVGMNQEDAVKQDGHDVEKGIIPASKANEPSPIAPPKRKNDTNYSSFEIEKIRELIIELLRTYEIPYDNKNNEVKLLYTLKDGIAALMNFITEAIDTAPKNLHMLENLRTVRGDVDSK